MKMPTAAQLPSGSWRDQNLVDGKRIGITEPTEEEAILKAMNIKHGSEQYKKEPLSRGLRDISRARTRSFPPPRYTGIKT